MERKMRSTNVPFKDLAVGEGRWTGYAPEFLEQIDAIAAQGLNDLGDFLERMRFHADNLPRFTDPATIRVTIVRQSDGWVCCFDMLPDDPAGPAPAASLF
jgi:hypothetical protein